MAKMTEKRFVDLFGCTYRSIFELGSRLNKEWKVSMDVSPYSGTHRFTTSFYKWVEDEKIPDRSGNKLFFRSQDFDKIKAFYENNILGERQ